MNDNKRDMRWRVLDSRYLFRRPWLTARQDKVQLPDGSVNDEYYVLEYPDWINVIAETDDVQLLIERQYRHGLGEVSYEICAGVIENGETPLQAAQRELQEETGFGGGEWHEMMALSPNSSSVNNISHCFYAHGVKKLYERHLDKTEDIEVYLFPRKKVFEMLEEGVFKQALMVAPLWKYFFDLQKKGVEL
jgi:8-oxo-dGTP pyrophosphatase MutT (NUDIX family)